MKRSIILALATSALVAGVVLGAQTHNLDMGGYSIVNCSSTSIACSVTGTATGAHSLAFGPSSLASDGSTAIGNSADASGSNNNNVVVGYASTANGTVGYGTVIGQGSAATGNQGTVCGSLSSAAATGTAVGSQAVAGAETIAIGANTSASLQGLAIGKFASAGGGSGGAMGLGRGASSSAYAGLAIGSSSLVNATEAIALGCDAYGDVANTFEIGSNDVHRLPTGGVSHPINHIHVRGTGTGAADPLQVDNDPDADGKIGLWVQVNLGGTPTFRQVLVGSALGAGPAAAVGVPTGARVVYIQP